MPSSFRINLPFLSFFENLCKPAQTQPSAPTAVSTQVDASTVNAWIHKFNTAFPRLEKISNNGLYSILEKEVQNVTSLLNEGQKISASSGNASDVASMINDVVKPRLAQLQTAYTDAQKKVTDHADEKKKDEEYEKLWNEKFQLPQSVLENHADCARFLKESGLLYNIVAYREGRPGNSHEHDVKLDPLDQHPMIKVQGQYVRWENLAKELHYDETSKKIKSQSYPGSIVQSWNYFQNGLVPIDRNDCEKAFPIWELTQEEYDRGLQQAKEFYKTNPEKDPGLPKDCYVRFYTNDRRALPGNCLLDNAERNFPGHIGIEVFMDGKMTQFGFALTPEDDAFIMSNPLSNAMATAEGKIGMLDFMALKPYNKIYTSVPLTKQRAQNILNRVNELKGQQLRFQYPRQNCTQLASEVLNIAGYDVDMRTNARDVVLSIFPSLNQIAFIAKIEDAVKRAWNNLPTCVTKPFEFTADVILYVPRKIGTVVTNLLMWKMGGNKKTTPLQTGAEDEEFYDKKGFQSFSTLFRNWKDIFKDETNAVYHSKYFIDWQKNQASTFHDDYEKRGRPKICILPEPTTATA